MFRFESKQKNPPANIPRGERDPVTNSERLADGDDDFSVDVVGAAAAREIGSLRGGGM